MTTTIKVPVRLRERVQAHARARNENQAAVLEHALDLLDREVFFEQLRRDVADSPESDGDKQARMTWLAGPLDD